MNNSLNIRPNSSVIQLAKSSIQLTGNTYLFFVLERLLENLDPLISEESLCLAA